MFFFHPTAFFKKWLVDIQNIAIFVVSIITFTAPFNLNLNGVCVFVILLPSKEHYYDGESGTGYLAWRIKTIQRSTARDRRLSSGGNAVIILEDDLRIFLLGVYMIVKIYGLFPCCVASSEGTSQEDRLGGPAARRESQCVPETVLSEDECKAAIALMKHSADEDTIKRKMKLTFDFRRDMVLDPQQSSDVLSVFPRYKDVKGLVIVINLF